MASEAITGLREALGRAGGALLAPVFAGVSALRRARTFHPSGIVVRASVRAIDHDPIGERLAGPAIARLSSAWWKEREWRDVLGIAIRFTSAREADHRAHEGDQDLLLATIRRPWTMPFAPFSTDHRDFLANHYFAVSPFRADPIEHEIELRIVPARTVADGATRRTRIARAIARGDAALILEVRRYRRAIDLAPVLRRSGTRASEPWRPIARIELQEIVDVDQDALRFDPFRAGRGVRPVGAIHSLRIAPYRASQQARPARAVAVGARRGGADRSRLSLQRGATSRSRR